MIEVMFLVAGTLLLIAVGGHCTVPVTVRTKKR